MSAPVGRETPARKAVTAHRKVEALARRPAPKVPAVGPSVSVRRDAADGVVNVPDGFAYVTVIPWTTVNWDTDGAFSLGDPTKLTAPTDGVYLVTGTCNYNGGFVGMVGAAIDMSPAGDFPGETQFYGDGTYFVNVQATALVKLLGGEFVEFTVEQKTGAARPLLNAGCNFGMTWVGEYP